MDLISRKEALKAVIDVEPYEVKKEEGHVFCTQVAGKVVDALYNVPTVSEEDAVSYLLDAGWLEEHDHVITTSWWITDLNPVADGRYLVTLHEYGNVGFELDQYKTCILSFANGKWNRPISFPEEVESALTKEVVAWMPLPPAYDASEKAHGRKID